MMHEVQCKTPLDRHCKQRIKKKRILGCHIFSYKARSISAKIWQKKTVKFGFPFIIYEIDLQGIDIITIRSCVETKTNIGLAKRSKQNYINSLPINTRSEKLQFPRDGSFRIFINKVWIERKKWWSYLQNSIMTAPPIKATKY